LPPLPIGERCAHLLRRDLSLRSRSCRFYAFPCRDRLIKFLWDAKLAAPGTGCRSWPVAPVSQGLSPGECEVSCRTLPGGIHPCALARGRYCCAPTLPSAHEEGRPSVLVEPRAPDVDEKNCETNPITSPGILAKLAWRDAERYGCRGELRAGGACRLALLLAWLQGMPGSTALVNACAAWRVTAQKCVGATHQTAHFAASTVLSYVVFRHRFCGIGS
jgi:hypothetical protein